MPSNILHRLLATLSAQSPGPRHRQLTGTGALEDEVDAGLEPLLVLWAGVRKGSVMSGEWSDEDSGVAKDCNCDCDCD
jgi:hypothetical protein